jgi:hypothetical protein
MHGAFASEESRRYAAECERMRRLARPVKRSSSPFRNYALLPLCFLLAIVVVRAFG